MNKTQNPGCLVLNSVNQSAILEPRISTEIANIADIVALHSSSSGRSQELVEERWSS